MKFTSTLLLLFVAVVCFSQTIPAKAYLTFDDGVVIPEGMSGISIVNGADNFDVDVVAEVLGEVLVKVDGAFVTIPSVDNELMIDGDENVYSMDYNGYLKIDETILNSSNFTLAMDYRWSGNNVWWVGIVSFVGNDVDDIDANEVTGWQSKHLAFKNPANGQVDGLGMQTGGTGLTQDTYGHLVLTYDEGNTVLYVNGVQVGASTVAQNIHLLDDLSLYIGAKLAVDAATGELRPSVEGTGKCKSTKQNIDNVVLIDRALNATEVAGIYSGDTGISSAIDEDVKVVSVDIYPNPVSDMIYISSKETSSVELYNIGGAKVIYSSDITNGVDISSLLKGVYFVKCINANGLVVATQKIIKK